MTDLWGPWVGTMERKVVPRCVSTISIVIIQEVSHVGHLVWFLANSQGNSNAVSIPYVVVRETSFGQITFSHGEWHLLLGRMSLYVVH